MSRTGATEPRFFPAGPRAEAQATEKHQTARSPDQHASLLHRFRTASGTHLRPPPRGKAFPSLAGRAGTRSARPAEGAHRGVRQHPPRPRAPPDRGHPGRARTQETLGGGPVSSGEPAHSTRIPFPHPARRTGRNGLPKASAQRFPLPETSWPRFALVGVRLCTKDSGGKIRRAARVGAFVENLLRTADGQGTQVLQTRLSPFRETDIACTASQPLAWRGIALRGPCVPCPPSPWNRRTAFDSSWPRNRARARFHGPVGIGEFSGFHHAWSSPESRGRSTRQPQSSRVRSQSRSWPCVDGQLSRLAVERLLLEEKHQERGGWLPPRSKSIAVQKGSEDNGFANRAGPVNPGLRRLNAAAPRSRARWSPHSVSRPTKHPCVQAPAIWNDGVQPATEQTNPTPFAMTLRRLPPWKSRRFTSATAGRASPDSCRPPSIDRSTRRTQQEHRSRWCRPSVHGGHPRPRCR